MTPVLVDAHVVVWASVESSRLWEPAAATLRTADDVGRLHRDPFDRLLAPQALVESLPVVTVNPAFDAYGVSTIR